MRLPDWQIDKDDGTWEKCAMVNCEGERLDGEHCLNHLEPTARSDAIKHLASQPTIRIRGIRLDERLFDEINREAPDDTYSRDWKFIGCSDSELIVPFKMKLTSDLYFLDCKFDHGFHFIRTEFPGSIYMADSTFGQFSLFRCEFSETFNLEGATVKATFRASDSKFNAGVFIDADTFRSGIDFSSSQVAGSSVKLKGQFAGSIELRNCELASGLETLRDDAVTSIEDSFRLTNCQVSSSFRFGPIKCGKNVVIADTAFSDRASWHTSHSTMTIRQTEFDRGASIRIANGKLNCDQAFFGAPSLIECAPDAELAPLPGKVDVVKLVDCHVHNLTVSNADLTNCVFAGSQGLEKLRLDGSVHFSRVPTRSRLAKRGVIFEELVWRAEKGSDRWKAACTEIGKFDGVQSLPLAQLARTYRSLRISREESGDYPGANDFFYGEMELRRADAPKWTPNKMVLTAYWGAAGYGLRPSRSAFALLLMVMLCAGLIATVGFSESSVPDRIGEALLISFSSVVAFFRQVPEELSLFGEFVSLSLRILGPVLIALTLIGVRSRVRR